MRPSSTLSYISVILLLVALIVSPIILGAIRPWIFLPPFFGLSILGIIGLYRAGKSLRHQSWKPDAIDLSISIFLLYALFRSWFTGVEYDGRLEILKIIAYSIVFFTCRYGVERRFQGLLILFTLLILGVGISLFGFLLKANPDFRPFGETFHIHYAPRLTATYGCPNHVVFFLVMTTSISLAIGFFSHLPWVSRIIILYSAIPMVIAIGLTLSRGGWIGFVFALLAITIFAVRLGKIKKWIPFVFLFLLLCGAGTFLYLNQDFNKRLMEGFDSETLMANKEYCRVQLFIDSLKISHDYPLFGTGPATFLYMHPRYQGPNYPSLAVFAHNDYTNTLTDYGIVGLTLALIAVTLICIKLTRSPQNEEEWHDKVFLCVAASAMSALILHSFFDFNLHIPANALIFFALIGLGLRLTHVPRPLTDKNPNPFQTLFRFTPLFLAALVLLYFIFQLQKTARGYFPVWSMQRQEASTTDEARIRILEAAATQDPQSTVIASALGDQYRYLGAKHKEKEIRFPLIVKSVHWYQIAHQLNPLDDTIVVRLAMSLDLMERYMESFQYYRLAIGNQPYNGYFWIEIASHYWRQGLLSKAMECYQATLSCPYYPKNISMEIELLQKEIDKAKERKRLEQELKKNSSGEMEKPSESTDSSSTENSVINPQIQETGAPTQTADETPSKL